MTRRVGIGAVIARFGSVGATADLALLAADPVAAGKQLPFDAILWLQLERTNP